MGKNRNINFYFPIDMIKIKELFHQFDRDGSGHIDRQDILAHNAGAHQPEKSDEDEKKVNWHECSTFSAFSQCSTAEPPAECAECHMQEAQQVQSVEVSQTAEVESTHCKQTN